MLGLVRDISMALCKTAVTPVHKHWSYCSLALSHRLINLPSTVHPMNYTHCLVWHCLVVVMSSVSSECMWWSTYPYPSGLLHWYWGNHIRLQCQWKDSERCNFHSRKWIWVWRLQHGSHFVSASKCWLIFPYLDLSLPFLVTFPLPCVVFVFLLNFLWSPYCWRLGLCFRCLWFN